MSSHPILATIFLAAIGMITARLGKKWLNLESSSLYISLFFSPIIFYLLLSGALNEFKGFGIEAKFREIALQKIDPNIRIHDSIAERKDDVRHALFGGGSNSAILKANTATDLNDRDRLKLAFEVGEQISASIAQGSFELLILVNESNHVLGHFQRHWFIDLMSIPDIHASRGSDPKFDQTDTERIERNLRKTYLWEIIANPQERVDTWGSKQVLSTDTTYLDAYRVLTQESASAMPVIDSSSRYAGIVRAEDIRNKIFEAILLSNGI